MIGRRRRPPSLASLPPISNAADQRAAAIDWQSMTTSLNADGYAILPAILSPDECATLSATYPSDELFRSHVVMARHGFGSGEYKYFSYPLPELIADLRIALYQRLAPTANRWNTAMGNEVRYPESHADFIRRCHDAGQLRPTPLLLQYGEGDYN